MLENRKNIFTGDIYEIYQKLCKKIGQRPLTQRRISDIIAELDMLGMINAKLISKGRYGRTREITVSLPSQVEENIKTILKKELEVISSKLDFLKASLETINRRLDNIESASRYEYGQAPRR